jgi:polyphosphate kinase 2 (PPK2 family)
MLEIQYLLFKRKIPLVVVYEGWDASGKGGNIMRITKFLNQLGYYVVPISAPTEEEKRHHYLRRFVKQFPPAGDIAIFDRSWYGRVLVERVEGFCSPTEWQRAYQEICWMEQDYIESSGGGLLKFWLEIDSDVQLKRFRQRASDPDKVWKTTEEDWRNREKWDQYDVAIDDMLAKTSTRIAPWTIIESDDKWYARTKTLRTIIDHCRTLL